MLLIGICTLKLSSKDSKPIHLIGIASQIDETSIKEKFLCD